MRRMLIILLAFCAVAASAQHDKPAIAVYSRGDMGINELKILNTEILRAIVKSGHYEAIERSDDFLAVVNREIVAQRFNNPDDTLIAGLARRAKAQYVGIVDVSQAFGEYHVSARIVNVETNFVAGKHIGSANGRLASIEDIMVASCEVVASMFGDKSDECAKIRSSQVSTTVQQTRDVSALIGFTISKLEFVNTDYNGNVIRTISSEINTSDLKYLSPLITYTYNGSSSEAKNLYVKIINPNGSIRQASSSPSGYTYTTSLDVSPNQRDRQERLTGWGNRDGGSYGSGTYTVEIWCDEKKLASENFKVTEEFLISRIELFNTDYNGNIIGTIGGEISTVDLKYLSPRITYTYNGSASATKYLYVKIINPNGSIRQTSSSPSGYTYMTSLDVSPNQRDRQERLTGWGNRDGGYYGSGTYTVEIWCDGKKLASKDFSVKALPLEWNSILSKATRNVDYSRDGRDKYKGQFSDGLTGALTGRGLYYWADGTYYLGEYSNNERTGKGMYLGRDGYEFSNSPNCAIYAGDINANLRSGTGTCYDRQGNLVYRGNFSNDRPTEPYPSTRDFSMHRFEVKNMGSNGDKYIGETKNGLAHGYGVYVWADGDIWHGHWEDNKRNGRGIYSYNSGGWVVQDCSGNDCRIIRSSSCTRCQGKGWYIGCGRPGCTNRHDCDCGKN